MSLAQLIRAPPTSIYHLHTKVTSQQSSAFPAGISSLLRELASKEDESKSKDTTTLSSEEYNHLMEEMVSCGNGMLKIVADKAEKMGSEQVYDADVLELYDTLVWGFNSPFLWRISESNIHDLYSSNISSNHAEIGVGTGLFLGKDVSCKSKSITLMDLNQNSLNVCEKRILRCFNEGEKAPNVNKLIVDIVKEDSSSPQKGLYDSVSANFLFHCLHGNSLQDKISAFKNCASLVSSEGVFFGSTILGKEMLNDVDGAGETSLGVLNNYNDWGIFGNLGDSFDELETILNELFNEVDLKKVGFCGVWTARGPK